MPTVRIRLTGETRKQLELMLRQAFRAGDLPLVKRVTVLLGIARGESMEVATTSVGVSRATGYTWLRALLAEGPTGLRVRWRGGRPAKLTATQRQRPARDGTGRPPVAGFSPPGF